jgi:hypothetical protein
MLRIVVFVTLALLSLPVAARDLGQWDGPANATVREWYKNLMQPDDPYLSCCGVADAYWADTFEVTDGHYVAIITDDRDDGPLLRPHRDMGERIAVPDNKMKFDAGNPTGHGVIFIGAGGRVFCYVTPGGV